MKKAFPDLERLFLYENVLGSVAFRQEISNDILLRKEDIFKVNRQRYKNGYKYLINVDFKKTLLLVWYCRKITEKTAELYILDSLTYWSEKNEDYNKWKGNIRP